MKAEKQELRQEAYAADSVPAGGAKVCVRGFGDGFADTDTGTDSSAD